MQSNQSSQSQPRQQSLQKLLQEKESIINKFVDRCNRQQQQLAQLMTQQEPTSAKAIPYKLYSPFLIPSHTAPQQFYLVLKISGSALANKQPIWASTNLQIVNGEDAVETPIKGAVKYFNNHTPPQNKGENSQSLQKKETGNFKKSPSHPTNYLSSPIATLKQKEQEEYCASLSKYAEQLKSNLATCQQFIEDLKELKQMDLMERQQDQNLHPPNHPKQDESNELRQKNTELEKQLAKLTAENQTLRTQIQELNDRDKNIFTSFRSDKQENLSERKAVTDINKAKNQQKKEERENQIKKEEKEQNKLDVKQDKDHSQISGSPWTIKTDDQFRRVRKPKVFRIGYE